jgi:hypothetical protein
MTKDLAHVSPSLPTQEDMDRLYSEASRSLEQIAPTNLVERIHAAHKERPDLFGKLEKELARQLRSESRTPAPVDNRIRLKFWTEYDRAQSEGDRFRTVNVYGGLCPHELFYNYYLKDPCRVAWMLCMPTSYQVKMEEGLSFGLDELRDVLEEPHTTQVDVKGPKGWVKKTVVNTKLIEAKIKIVQMMDLRLKGGVVQKQLNIHATTKALGNMVQSASMEDLHKRLKELEHEKRKALHLPETESSEAGEAGGNLQAGGEFSTGSPTEEPDEVLAYVPGSSADPTLVKPSPSPLGQNPSEISDAEFTDADSDG